MEAHWISARQIEAARRVMTRFTKRGGKIWIRIFPDMPVTQKGGEIPMGKGKGSVDHYVAVVKPGTVMFEMDGITRKTIAKEAMELAAYKTADKCKFVTRGILIYGISRKLKKKSKANCIICWPNYEIN
jgi:large subunit ribosomal protein L16